MSTRICRHCDRQFEANNGGRGQWLRWCSDRCETEGKSKAIEERLSTYRMCEVDGCSKRVRSGRATHCETHYYRMRRNGTLALTKPQRAQRDTCTVDGCETLDAGPHGLCAMHHTRDRRHGDPHTKLKPPGLAGEQNPNWLGDDAGYYAMHDRVKRSRGTAKQHQCVDCGTQAQHWSYNHTDPRERVAEHLGPYGLSGEHYSPRCVRCHKRFDLDHINPQGDHPQVTSIGA